ncbi:hypothetical protein [Streptomyces sp. NPDC014995]|uniref:hypothetical protein n=1 Tax=Streptomyces sp. NPDC014995 TaxID=3364936 RepID=UPI0036F70C8F
MWRTRWSVPDPEWGDATHPPVLLVSNQVGPRPAPRRDAALARRAEEARHRLAQEAAEREAQRPVCADCGQKFTDDWWKASVAVDWGRGDSHPHLCDDCKARALEAERQVEQAERERQEQERQEEAAAQALKAGGWLGRWRS